MNVVFLVYRRPDLTARAFAEIRRARPEQLLVVADGPRGADEEARCAATRAIASAVDWPCKLHTNFADANLGCRRRVASGLTWAFGLVDEAVILEDDCLPDPSFFTFCTDLLDRYRHEKRVMAVTGDNFQDGRRRTKYSYYFSKYPHCWGWATWRRAWRLYDPDMDCWPTFRASPAWPKVCSERDERQYWEAIFSSVAAGNVDSWAFPWTLTCWRCGGLTAVPECNLVKNVGFGGDSTHTRNADSVQAELDAKTMTFPLKHPRRISRNVRADRFTHYRVFMPRVGPVERLMMWRWRLSARVRKWIPAGRRALAWRH